MAGTSRSPAKVILITGASSGIGLMCAQHLRAQGHTVYGASRRAGQASVAGVLPLAMDVNDDGSVQDGIERIVAEQGRLDVVVNCAGFGIAGAVENTSVDEAKHQFETNFFGTLRVCRQVLPVMRQQQAGLIVNVSSLGGLVAIPFQGLYSASKFAVEGMTEALRMEVAPFGIKVVLIAPGDFATGFTAQRIRTAQALTDPTYQREFNAAVAIMERDEQNGPSPERIARLLARIIATGNPKLRYSIGRTDQRLGVWLKAFLPQGLYERLVMQTYGLS